MAGSGSGSGSPCGACKFLRRKCVSDCIFAPYFGCEQGAARFAAIHKIFGASNVSKLLLRVPVADRCEAVVTVAYEAQARVRDPVYGCVAHIFALQQQVATLQEQVMRVRAQLAHGMVGSRSLVDQWQTNVEANAILNSYSNQQSMSQLLDGSLNGPSVQGTSYKSEIPPKGAQREEQQIDELGELRTLALKMMRT